MIDDDFSDELFDGAFCILNAPLELEKAMQKEVAKANLQKTARQILKLLK